MTFDLKPWMLMLVLPCALIGPAGAAPAEEIHLALSPRICSLGPRDKQCKTVVHANWQAERSESLCLVIRERKDVKQCWENYESGIYSVELTFTDDLTFELRDPNLQQVLASEILRVIREAIQYRHRRREPWNIFD